MNLGIGLGVTNYLRVPTVAINPDDLIAALFSSGEEGAWYDPSDLTTLYQDAAGTTPVTGTGQPVGLMLDKSKGGLQAEQVTNGGFDSATGWTLTGSAAITGGELVFVSGGSGSASYPVSFSAGQQVRVAIDKTVLGAAGGANAGLRFTLSGGAVIGISIGGANGPRYYEQLLTLPGNVDAVEVLYNGSGAYEYKFDNVSVRELPGNHATQSTSTARPTLQLDGSSYYLDFEGVDDRMAALFVSVQAQPNTVVFAGRADVAAGYLYDSEGDGTQRNAVYLRAAPDIWQTFAGSDFVNHQITTGSDFVLTSHFNSTLSSGRVNGVLSASGNAGSIGSSGISLASRYSLAGYLNGRIYGFINVCRTLDPDEITNVESYLADKTGFTAPVITGVPTISVS